MRPRRPVSWLRRPGERRRIRWPKFPCCEGDRAVLGWAACDPGDKLPGEIAVSALVTPPEQAQILLHEIVHYIDRSLTEEQVDQVAAGLLAFRVLNPEVDEWLRWAVLRG